MSVKKAKGKGKATANRTAAKKTTSKEKPKKSKGIEEVREDISDLVKESASDIATSVIEVATRTGQLASARYLFEAVGIYPPSEQTEERPLETTMAHQLLTKMGIPLEPVVYDPDAEPADASDAETAQASDAASDDAAEHSGEENRDPREDEE